MASTAPSSQPPSLDPKYQQLFEQVEAALQKTEKIQGERWHVVAIACLVAGPDPDIAAAQLYTHLCSKPQFSTSASRQALVRRLREALFKSISLVGVCKPIEAILAINSIEKSEDKDYSFSRKDWQCDSENLEKAMAWYRKIYTRNAKDTMGLFDAHQDFAWVSANITYGLYLSDRQILDDLDTELGVLCAIMSQNLKTETWWHIRGTRRIGVSKEDTQVLCDTIRLLSRFYGVELNRVPSVDEVEHDV